MTIQSIDDIIQLISKGNYMINGNAIFTSEGYDFPVGRIQKDHRVWIPYASHPTQIYDADRFREFCEEHDLSFVEYASHQFVIKNIKEHAERFNAIAKRLKKRIKDGAEQS